MILVLQNQNHFLQNQNMHIDFDSRQLAESFLHRQPFLRTEVLLSGTKPESFSEIESVHRGFREKWSVRRKWFQNQNGMVLESKWIESGIKMEWFWNQNGMVLESKCNGSGIKME